MRIFSRTSVLTLCLLPVLAAAGCIETAALDTPRITGDPTPASTTGRPSPGSGGGSSATATAGDSAQSEPAPIVAACQVPSDKTSWEAEVLRLTNIERAQRGVAPLAWSDGLAAQADSYACEMIEDDFFAHVNPLSGEGLRDRAEQASYQYWAIGENLAGGQTTPAQVVREWMDSPDHRENILNPGFTELGVGVRLGGDYRIYWVQEFGRPISAGPMPS